MSAAILEWSAGHRRFRITADGVLEMLRGGNWWPHYLNHQCPQVIREFAALAAQVHNAEELFKKAGSMSIRG